MPPTTRSRSRTSTTTAGISGAEISNSGVENTINVKKTRGRSKRGKTNTTTTNAGDEDASVSTDFSPYFETPTPSTSSSGMTSMSSSTDIPSKKPRRTASRTRSERKETKTKDNTNKQIVEKAKTGRSARPKKTSKPKADLDDSVEDMISHSDSDDSDSGWEEVEDAPIDEDPMLLLGEGDGEHHLPGHELSSQPSIPEGGLEIELQHPSVKRKNAEKAELERLRVNRHRKQTQENVHKSHLLCLLARGIYLNRISMSDKVIGSLCISHLPVMLTGINPDKETVVNQSFIENIVNSFKSYFFIYPSNDVGNYVRDRLISALENKTSSNNLDYTLSFLSILRSTRYYFKFQEPLQIRFVQAFCPLPMKANNLLLSDKQKKIKKSNDSSKTKQRTKIQEILLSSSDDDEVVAVKNSDDNKTSPSKDNSTSSINSWIEVYLTTEKRWICVDPVSGVVDEPDKIEQLIGDFNYIISFDDNGFMKEVTGRYSCKFLMSSFRRLRVDFDWLSETLSSFHPGNKTPQEEDEDREIEGKLSALPLPTTVGEFKGHPLYLLKRHLLVYEAIYPPDTQPISMFKGEEEIYSRSCIHPVRSDLYWKRQGRILKEGESPYKVVKGRKKWDRYAQRYIQDTPNLLYGFWQTEEYIPPTAVDGIVPKNEYGNVELFVPSMLPKGCVHLTTIPGLGRLALKLGIDVASAVVGFDAVKHGIVPVIDGFVVCEEHVPILREAYQEEMRNQRMKERTKKLMRIHANWRRLTIALLMRERVRREYFAE